MRALLSTRRWWDGTKPSRSCRARYLVSRFFRNSPELLVLNLLEDEELDAKELSRIRKMVAGEAKRWA